jgi:Protein of unknown function (DUF5661)
MGNKIKGGKADTLTLEMIAKKFNVSIMTLKQELEVGIKIESEHTTNSKIAREIALDHLSEIPDYYTRLVKMEKMATKKWGNIDETKKLIKKLVFEQLVSLTEAFTHNNQFLYHTTNMRNYNYITKHGLIPTFGDTVKQAYGGYYNLDGSEEDDEEDENRRTQLDFDGLLFFSEYPMLGYSQTMQQNFKLNEALVCVVKKNDTIFHKIDDYPKYTDYKGSEVTSINYNSVYDLPLMIETGDWFSFDEQTPVKLLEGRYIIEFMKKNFPNELSRYVK